MKKFLVEVSLGQLVTVAGNDPEKNPDGSFVDDSFYLHNYIDLDPEDSKRFIVEIDNESTTEHLFGAMSYQGGDLLLSESDINFTRKVEIE